ncbi:DoxX-like family protein [Zooshikella sp. RANM57]|uniref:DoxX-like family protein n=1 Tax=Zooshikella sp. RANM57 TaxID=3425863 RepID=UPI003D6E4CCF
MVKQTNSLAYLLCRTTISFIWLYHGLIPKLLWPHKDEIAMNMTLGLSYDEALAVAQVGGLLEIGMAIILLFFWQKKWPLVATAAAMVGLLIFVTIATPQLLTGAFNPVTTNISVFVLAFTALILHQPTKMTQGSYNKV